MTMAAKLVQCIASFSRASLSPALGLPRGLTAQLHRRFVSSSGLDREAVVNVDLEKRQIYASDFMNKTGLNPTEVGNSRTAGILEQTTIIDAGFRPICLDMQATTSTVPRVLNATLSVHTSLYRIPHSCTGTCGWETAKVIHVACQQAAEFIGAHSKDIIFTPEDIESNNFLIKCVAMIYKSNKHITTSQIEHVYVLDSCRHLQDVEYYYKCLPIQNNSLINWEHFEKVICPDTALVSIIMANNEIGVLQPTEEIEKPGRKNGVFFCIHGALSVGNTPVDVGMLNDDLTSISGPKVYGTKDIGARNTHHRPKVRIDLLISGSGRERGLRSGIHAHSLAFAFGEPCRISQEENEYTCTSNSFFPQNSICSSTVLDNNYAHKRYHNKQPRQFIRALWTMGHHKVDMKTSKPKATTEDSWVGIGKTHLTEVPNTKADKNTNKKRRNLKRTTLYSKMTTSEAENRLGLTLDLRGIPVKRMLEGKCALLVPDIILKLKGEVYQGLVSCINFGGYPTEAHFGEGNINSMVAFTITPIVAQFARETERKLRLLREKKITSKDSSTGGVEEFVVMDYISYNQKKYVLVVDAKKVSLGEAIKRCFLSLKDTRDLNGGGTVYGFITQGDSWRMISFDGEFKMSEKIELLFDTMDQQEERWMADYSILVECLNVALSNGGKDRVEVV